MSSKTNGYPRIPHGQIYETPRKIGKSPVLAMGYQGKKVKQPAKLFPQEAKLLRRLKAAPFGVCSVAQLAVVIFPPKTLAKLRKDKRTMHQRVGTVVFRLNKKHGYKIAPVDGKPGIYAL